MIVPSKANCNRVISAYEEIETEDGDEYDPKDLHHPIGPSGSDITYTVRDLQEVSVS